MRAGWEQMDADKMLSEETNGDECALALKKIPKTKRPAENPVRVISVYRLRGGEKGRYAIFDCIHRMLPAHGHFLHFLITLDGHFTRKAVVGGIPVVNKPFSFMHAQS